MGRRWRAPADADGKRLAPNVVFAAGLENHHVSNTAYPIAHQRTFAPYRVARGDQRAVAVAAFDEIRDLGLYVHVPFCETRCAFCEYTVVPRAESQRGVEYVDALLGELALWDQAIGLGDRTFCGLDIGGGTPTFLPAAQLVRILDAVRARARFAPGADVSVETTPRLAARRADDLTVLRNAGVDRISMGVQVAESELLAQLGRDGNGVREQRLAVDNIRNAGFSRLNLDLMYGFAGQSLASWQRTLEHAVALGPEAITLYRMRYKLTRISHQAQAVTLVAVRRMIQLAKEVLLDAGYHAPPGKTTYSRDRQDVGTSSYLARRVVDGMPYLGLGLGAQSFTHTTLSYNDGAVGKNLKPYLRSVAAGRLPLQDLYDLPREQVMGKMAAVSFYFGEIDRAGFERKFGTTLEQELSSEIDFAVRHGLMRWTDRSLALTAEGALSLNGVIALFFAPSVQRYLVERDARLASDFDPSRRRALKVAGEVLTHV